MNVNPIRTNQTSGRGNEMMAICENDFQACMLLIVNWVVYDECQTPLQVENHWPNILTTESFVALRCV